MVKDALPTPDEWAAAKREPSDGVVTAAVAHVSMSAELLQEVIEASRAGLPNESCGLLVSDRYAEDGASPSRYIPLRNAAESPYRYLIDSTEQLKVWMELDDTDEVVWAIVHSHVASPARPSATDVGLAFYPDSLYVICSLASVDQPEVRAWSIRDGAVSEIQLGVG